MKDIFMLIGILVLIVAAVLLAAVISRFTFNLLLTEVAAGAIAQGLVQPVSFKVMLTISAIGAIVGTASSFVRSE